MEDANIACLSFKNLVILIRSNSGISTGRLLSKLKTLDDSSRSAQEFTLYFSTRQISNAPNTSYRGKEIGLFVSLTNAIVKAASSLLLLIKGSTRKPGEYNNNERQDSKRLYKLMVLMKLSSQGS